MNTPDSAALDRRGFLKLGFSATAAVGAVSLGAGLAGCHAREQAAAAGYGWLQDADLALFRALLPAVLPGLLPEADAARETAAVATLRAIDRSALRLGPPAQQELRKLLDLLNLAPTRRLLARVPLWAQTTPAEAGAFLDRWRNSSVGLFNAGYSALVKLVAASYFSLPASWPQAGYPGPPAWASAALNAGV